jgi:hypothetical protein
MIGGPQSDVCRRTDRPGTYSQTNAIYGQPSLLSIHFPSENTLEKGKCMSESHTHSCLPRSAQDSNRGRRRVATDIDRALSWHATLCNALQEVPFIFDASMSSVAGNKITLAKRLDRCGKPAVFLLVKHHHFVKTDSGQM